MQNGKTKTQSSDDIQDKILTLTSRDLGENLGDARADASLNAHLCEPCQSQNKSCPATLFCSDCDNECLCAACGKHHNVQKLTQSHTLQDILLYIEIANAEVIRNHTFCEPCKKQGKTNQAAFFCVVCDNECLCMACGKHHNLQKITRDHQLQDIYLYASTSASGNQRFCEPCKAQNKSFPARFFCEDCDNECLCDSCGKHHNLQKITRCHVLQDISEYVEIAVTEDIENQHLCETCEAQGKTSPAAFFCVYCDNECLCDACGAHHTVQKLTRDHKLKDIKLYASTNTTGNQRFCEPCKAINKYCLARFFCADCDNECLCDSCGKHHNLQKITRSHTLHKISQYVNIVETKVIAKQHLCEPCKAQGKSCFATSFCAVCDFECLCKACGKNHSSHKKLRDHILQDINQYATALATKDHGLCDPCKAMNRSSPAAYVCVVCDNEFLCEACGKYHNFSRSTHGHRLHDILHYREVARTKTYSKQTFMCKPCKAHKKDTLASCFCAVCDNEWLCGPCGKYHSSQKSNRDHKIQDICLYVDIKASDKHNFHCEACKAHDKQVPAVFFCNECEDEMFCVDCGKYHDSKKLRNGHTLQLIKNYVNANTGNKHRKLCDPCASKNKTCPAFYVCDTCDNELLCQNCGNSHKLNESYQKHVLQNLEDLEHVSISCSSDEEVLNNIPGRPIASNIGFDTLTLSWTTPGLFKQGSHYQISCKCKEDNDSKWMLCQDNVQKNIFDLSNLKSNTKFVFRIRAVYHDCEGQYSEESEIVTTLKSPASKIIAECSIYGDIDIVPLQYALRTQENKQARNKQEKIRKIEIGKAMKGNYEEKTILLIGETGTGKSTHVDGIVNFIFGVNWDDPFRLRMVTLEKEEIDKHSNQAVSQTRWITCYTIYRQIGGRVPYAINIIDTPGFGDTEGIEKDQKIVKQIHALFTMAPPKGICSIDAVCFLIKASGARLNTSQKYIFQAIMSLFGKDIEDNICSVITFADGQEPAAIAAMKESKLPFGKPFKFNNSALFSTNINVDDVHMTRMFWDMGQKSFKLFFEYLELLHTKSLLLTGEVLNERYRLEATVKNLVPFLDRGLVKINALQSQIKCFEENKSIIAQNKEFKYKVMNTVQKTKELPTGQHVTNCLICNFTCHEICKIPEDEKKKNCWAMEPTTGFCKICPANCFWEKHKNTRIIFEYVVVEEVRTYADMKKKYEDASGKALNQKQLIETLKRELQTMVKKVDDMMDIVNTCNNRLSEIALKPNPLSTAEYIDMQIKNEYAEMKQGWQERIVGLEILKKHALNEVTDNVGKFKNEASAYINKKNIFQRIMEIFGL